MRTALDALITEKSLEFVRGGEYIEALDSNPLDLKNVCARVSPELADEIDKIVGLLDIRKRTFLEAAFLDAVDKAKAIMRAEGVFDRCEPAVDPSQVLEFSE